MKTKVLLIALMALPMAAEAATLCTNPFYGRNKSTRGMKFFVQSRDICPDNLTPSYLRFGYRRVKNAPCSFRSNILNSQLTCQQKLSLRQIKIIARTNKTLSNEINLKRWIRAQEDLISSANRGGIGVFLRTGPATDLEDGLNQQQREVVDNLLETDKQAVSKGKPEAVREDSGSSEGIRD